MAIAQAVFSRRQRDKLRKIIGPDLVFIVLNMTKECQMKRIKGRHGDSPMLEEFMRVLVKYAEMCEPAGDDEENAFNVTISEDMSKDDVVKKVLEVVNNLDKKARILLQSEKMGGFFAFFYTISILSSINTPINCGTKLTLVPSGTSIATIMMSLV